MKEKLSVKPLFVSGLFAFAALSFGCQANTTTSNANLVNTNVNISNSFANSANTNMMNSNLSAESASMIESKEPDVYQALVKMTVEALGSQQNTKLPAVGATVARNGEDRRMEITLPTNEKVIYLDKASTNYVILPNRKQYAEINKDSVGVDVRRMLTPGEIVKRVQNLQGVERVGEEQLNGRTVVKYRYGSVANTQTQAGNVQTESFLVIDKETGLPLVSETISQSQSGGNVQGYQGLKLVTEMTNIKTEAEPSLFELPADYQKVDAEQIKTQLNMVMQLLAGALGQILQSAGTGNAPAVNQSVTPTPQQ